MKLLLLSCGLLFIQSSWSESTTGPVSTPPEGGSSPPSPSPGGQWYPTESSPPSQSSPPMSETPHPHPPSTSAAPLPLLSSSPYPPYGSSSPPPPTTSPDGPGGQPPPTTSPDGPGGQPPPTTSPDGPGGQPPPTTSPDGPGGQPLPTTSPDGPGGQPPPTTSPNGPGGQPPPTTAPHGASSSLPPPNYGLTSPPMPPPDGTAPPNQGEKPTGPPSVAKDISSAFHSCASQPEKFVSESGDCLFPVFGSATVATAGDLCGDIGHIASNVDAQALNHFAQNAHIKDNQIDMLTGIEKTTGGGFIAQGHAGVAVSVNEADWDAVAQEYNIYNANSHHVVVGHNGKLKTVGETTGISGVICQYTSPKRHMGIMGQGKRMGGDSLLATNIFEKAENCAIDCHNNHLCLSFAFSKVTGECQLAAKSDPTAMVADGSYVLYGKGALE